MTVTEPYNQGGVIPGGEVTWKVEEGERVMTGDETVYELQAVEGGYQWVEIGKGHAMWMGGPK